MPAKTDLPKWFTAPEVAAILRVSPATVRQLVREGQLEGVNMAGPQAKRPRLAIPPDALDRFRESRRVAVEPSSRKRRRVAPQPVKKYV